MDTRPWRVGNKDDRPAGFAKSLQGAAGRRKTFQAVMHHTPDVAEKNVIGAPQRGKPVNDFGQVQTPIS